MGTFYPFLSGRDNLRALARRFLAVPSACDNPTEGLKFSSIVARKAGRRFPGRTASRTGPDGVRARRAAVARARPVELAESPPHVTGFAGPPRALAGFHLLRDPGQSKHR